MICVSEWIRRLSADPSSSICNHGDGAPICSAGQGLLSTPIANHTITPLKQREWFSSWSVSFETLRLSGIFQSFIRIDLVLHSGNITTTWKPKSSQKSCLYKKPQMWGPQVLCGYWIHFAIRSQNLGSWPLSTLEGFRILIENVSWMCSILDYTATWIFTMQTVFVHFRSL